MRYYYDLVFKEPKKSTKLERNDAWFVPWPNALCTLVGDMRAALDLKNSLSLNTAASGFYITKVVYNDPATIVWWSDGSKTVVRCQKGDTYSPETGLAMAICKRVFGNDNKFNKVFARWLPHDEV